MKTRKIILLSATAVLACAYALTLALSSGSSVKTFALSDKPDALVIEKGDGATLAFSLDGGNWVLGDRKYPTDAAELESALKAVEKIKALEPVSSGGDDERYGLGASAVSVIVKKGGKELRRIAVGKASATGQQSYVKIDGGSSVFLVSGNFKRMFDKTADNFRDRRIFDLKTADVTAIELIGKENYRLNRTADGWSSVPAAKMDKAKVDQWLSSIATLKAEGFPAEGTQPAGKPLGSIRFTVGGKTAALTVLAQDGGKYVCSSSESPYAFYIPEYALERYNKPLKELTAQ